MGLNNNLKVPSKNAAEGAVSELITSLLPEGVDPEFKLTEALTYSSLMTRLEELGLVVPVPPSSKSRPSKASLSKTSREKVYFSEINKIVTIYIRSRLMSLNRRSWKFPLLWSLIYPP